MEILKAAPGSVSGGRGQCRKRKATALVPNEERLLKAMRCSTRMGLSEE